MLKSKSYLVFISRPKGLASRRKDAKTQRKNAENLKIISNASNTVFDEIGIEVD